MILKTLRSFRFAFQGIYWMIRSENNARVHLCATILVVAAGVYFQLKSDEWKWILLCICLVWTLEMVNTALEKLVNLVSPGYHPEAGKIKDLAAAAVLVSAFFAIACAVFIFIPYCRNLKILH